MRRLSGVALALIALSITTGCTSTVDRAKDAHIGWTTETPSAATQPPAPVPTSSLPLTSKREIDLLTSDWTAIDGDLDNAADLAIEDGDDYVIDTAARIRDAGFQQNPDWPSDAETLESWPAEGQMSHMTLTVAEWEFIEEQLGRSAEIYDAIAAEPSDLRADEDEDWSGIAADCRRVAAQIHTELDK